MTQRRIARPYKEALDWLVRNDYTEWLDAEYGFISVTACLVADIYGRTDEEVTADLRRAKARFEKEDIEDMRSLILVALLAFGSCSALALSACVPLIPKTACTALNVTRGTADCSNYSGVAPSTQIITVEGPGGHSSTFSVSH